MKEQFLKNYTDKGYAMHYLKPQLLKEFKNIIYQFKIELKGIKPLIWRRIQVPSDYNFWELHVAIQDAMGWQDRHLHQFDVPYEEKEMLPIGIPDFDGPGDYNVLPGWEIFVCDFTEILTKGVNYVYDYGDEWRHNVRLEGVIFKEPRKRYPQCIDGQRACPPEDCGGVPGYLENLKIIKNPRHPEYKDLMQWLPDKYDPEAFSAAKVKFDNPAKRWENAFI